MRTRRGICAWPDRVDGVGETVDAPPDRVFHAGFGAHEGIKLKDLPQLHAQYDARSRYLKPLEGEDGSYAESVEDVFARVRSVLSNCETSRCGEEIVIVAPGADLLSIASAMLRGDDLRTHFKNKPPPGAVVHFGDMAATAKPWTCLLYTSPSPRDA